MTQFIEINGVLYKVKKNNIWTIAGFNGKIASPPTAESCPFCGSNDIHTFQPTAYEIGDEASVRCEDCGAEIRGETLEIALKKWNRRVNE